MTRLCISRCIVVYLVTCSTIAIGFCSYPTFLWRLRVVVFLRERQVLVISREETVSLISTRPCVLQIVCFIRYSTLRSRSTSYHSFNMLLAKVSVFLCFSVACPLARYRFRNSENQPVSTTFRVFPMLKCFCVCGMQPPSTPNPRMYLLFC